MVNVNDFKTGMTISYEGNLYQVLEFQHVKPGKGAAIVKTKLKNLCDENITNYSHNSLFVHIYQYFCCIFGMETGTLFGQRCDSVWRRGIAGYVGDYNTFLFPGRKLVVLGIGHSAHYPCFGNAQYFPKAQPDY